MVALGEFERAAELLPLVEAAIGECNYMKRMYDGRSTRLLAAIAATAAGARDRAADHFSLARSDAIAYGPRSVADCNYFESWALFHHGSDRERAAALRGAAIERYQALGMIRHVALARELGSR
jgi:hypothetical protein